MLKNLPKTKKGFTLIELLIVIAILGALASIVIIRFTGTQATARDTRRQSDLRQYQTSLEVYANRSNSLYPVRSSTVNVTSICSILGLPACPDDPQGTNAYRYQSSASGINYVLWARMEKTNTSGQSEYYVLCSTGEAGKANVSGFSVSGGNCPI